MRSDFCEIMADLARAEIAEIYATHPAHDMPLHAKTRLRELRKKLAVFSDNAEHWREKENGQL